MVLSSLGHAGRGVRSRGARWLLRCVAPLGLAWSASHAQVLTPRALPVVTPRAGLVLTTSARIRPGVYRLPGRSTPDSAILTVRGSNLTVDLRGVTFVGSPADSAPDAARGTALLIDGGHDVTVRGLTARGYHVGILARGTRNLTLRENNLSYGWKPRLFSGVEHESLNDWLSYHKNDADQWLRFGAGIYLSGVTGGAVTANTVRQGMNGLLITRTDSVDIRDNDFSYNSGLGIGMYRASWNQVIHNRADYNVRGYSHGFFARGQDSAALLMFEQCTHNMVAYNSMTHSGDGLFLWAGQETMDTGKGGSNDNVFLLNDFSYAPTNGMEATFSRNQFVGNLAVGNTHGLWGGYSYESRIVGNCFANNRIGIAIEHGQDNLIGGNMFSGDTLAIRLWADSVAPSDWGYPKARDTRSRDWRIVENQFVGVKARWQMANSTIIDSSRNVSRDSATHAANRRVQRAAAFDSVPWCDPAGLVPGTAYWRLPRIENEPRGRPVSAEASRDRSAIRVDAWGPYDGQSPAIFPLDSTRATPLRLAVRGPRGSWRVVGRSGVGALSRVAGRTGDTLVVTPAPGRAHDWQVAIEYRGAATVSPRGVRRAAGVPQRVAYTHWEPVQRWTQRVFAWTDSTNPHTAPAAFAELLRGTPLLERTEPRLDWYWSRPRDAAIPARRMAMEATSTVTLPEGVYTLRTLSDDAVRVWVNDSLVIDHWAPHETAPATALLRGGRQQLRVQYVQLEGWVELRVEILRGIVRASDGSPGPH